MSLTVYTDGSAINALGELSVYFKPAFGRRARCFDDGAVTQASTPCIRSMSPSIKTPGRAK